MQQIGQLIRLCGHAFSLTAEGAPARATSDEGRLDSCGPPRFIRVVLFCTTKFGSSWGWRLVLVSAGTFARLVRLTCACDVWFDSRRGSTENASGLRVGHECLAEMWEV